MTRKLDGNVIFIELTAKSSIIILNTMILAIVLAFGSIRTRASDLFAERQYRSAFTPYSSNSNGQPVRLVPTPGPLQADDSIALQKDNSPPTAPAATQSDQSLLSLVSKWCCWRY